jgi:hypothetical protein
LAHVAGEARKSLDYSSMAVFKQSRSLRAEGMTYVYADTANGLRRFLPALAVVSNPYQKAETGVILAVLPVWHQSDYRKQLDLRARTRYGASLRRPSI